MRRDSHHHIGTLTKYFSIFFLFLILGPFCSNAAGFTMVSVTGEKVNLRQSPSTHSPVLWELGKGFPLKIIGRKGKWLKVSDFESDVGWIYEDLVARKPHLIVKIGKNKKTRINVRSGPGTNYEVIGKAEYGVVFETLVRKNGWVKVRHEDGLIGWVKRSLLWGW